MIEAGIVSLLSADAGFSSFVGNNFFPAELPANPTYPAVVYKVVSANSTYSLKSNEIGLKRIQFECYGSTNNGRNGYSDAKTAKQYIRDVLSGYSGTLSDGTRILSCLRGVEIDNFISADSPIGVYRTLVDYLIQYVEP